MNYIDIIIIVVIALLALRGFFRGFLVSLLKTLSVIISFFVAKFFYLQLAAFIFKKAEKTIENIADGVRSFVVGSFSQGGGQGIDFEKLLGEKSPELASSLNGDLSALDGLKQLPENMIGTQVDAAVDALTAQISTLVINAVSFIAIFLLALLIINIIILIASLIRKLPLIGSMDGALGLVLGIVEGVLLSMLFVFMVKTFGKVDMMQNVVGAVEHSFVAKYLWEFSAKIFYTLLQL